MEKQKKKTNKKNELLDIQMTIDEYKIILNALYCTKENYKKVYDIERDNIEVKNYFYNQYNEISNFLDKFCFIIK